VIQREKTRWTEYLGFLAIQKKIPLCEPGERRSVRVTFYRPGPASDADNAHAACKVCLDAMKRAGLIEDDSPKHITLAVSTVPSSKSRTVIELDKIPVSGS